MISNKTAWATFGPTSLFVLLWSSGALFSKLGLQHASPFAFLSLRFALALAVLLALGLATRRYLPARGTRVQVALTGLLMIGSYSICHLLALDHGLTPGVLATVLGVQPILTLALTERQAFSGRRLTGLGLALAGLVLVVYESIARANFTVIGMLFAFGALVCVTLGAILQKSIRQAPREVLPLQLGCSLLLCLLFAPFQPMTADLSLDFWVALVWMGVVMSVVATLLLYRLIHAGNLVNVTSLFYLVPVGTALLDYVVLGNRLAPLSLAGMLTILLGLQQVFRKTT
ncbi:DMT family transporter [Polaromonas sp. YR568]|uniref:DMT family transporter n=1 Tax=Polaromonas sp. YR568 TaxID=1855301 RepID=UPI003137D5BE